LIRAYRSMATIRRFEERVQGGVFQGRHPGFVHLYAGEEASAVGMCMHLGPKDYLASPSGARHSIAKGCDVVGMNAGAVRQGGRPLRRQGGSMHIADLNEGAPAPQRHRRRWPALVVGAAPDAKDLGTGNRRGVLLGDGASNQGTKFEAINMAVVLKLPAVFVFENNQYGRRTGVAYAVGTRTSPAGPAASASLRSGRRRRFLRRP